MKRMGLASLLFVRRENPLVWALRRMGTPIDARALLAVCVVLSFIPITLGYAVEHNVVTSIAQSSTQILLIALSLLIVATGRVGFGWDTGTAVLLVLCIGASQMLAVFHSPSTEKNYVMPAVFPLFLLAGPIAKSLAGRIRLETNGRYVAKVANFLLGFFSVECVTRYVFSPFVRTKLDVAAFGVDAADKLYRYKQSIFFADSNSTGLALLCLVAAILVFREHVTRRQIILAYALMIATLSRASITAALCQFLIYKFWRRRRWVLAAFIFSAPVAILLLFAAYTAQGPDAFMAVDGSFASKFLILQRMVGVYSEADTLQRLVGIGVGNTQGIIGIAAHSIIATFALELGVVGSGLIVAYVWFLRRRSSKTFYLLVVPVIVNGFSLVLPSMPFFYIALGALSVVKDSRMEASDRRNILSRILRAPLWRVSSTAADLPKANA